MKKDKINIIYEDKYILVVNKSCGLLTVSTTKEKEKTLFHKVYMYVKQKNKSNKIFIIHRLDKDTSGLVVFAKSELIKKRLQDNWDQLVKSRKYIAVVEGIVEKNKDTIKSYLKENKNLVIYSTNDNTGKLAITKYIKINTSKSYSLLDIEILTGRKNQIRVHMKDINHPIIGDKKYDAKTNPLKRLGLHANELVIIHPITKELLTFKAKIPNEFLTMFKTKGEKNE